MYIGPWQEFKLAKAVDKKSHDLSYYSSEWRKLVANLGEAKATEYNYLSSEDAIRLLKGSLLKPPKEDGSVRYTQSELNPSLPPLSRTSKRSYHSDIRNTTTNTTASSKQNTQQQFTMKNKRLNMLRKKKPAYCQPSTAFQSSSSSYSPSNPNKKSKPSSPLYPNPNTPKYPKPPPPTQYWSSSSYNSSPLKATEPIYTNTSISPSYKPSSRQTHYHHQQQQQQQIPPPEPSPNSANMTSARVRAAENILQRIYGDERPYTPHTFLKTIENDEDVITNNNNNTYQQQQSSSNTNSTPYYKYVPISPITISPQPSSPSQQQQYNQSNLTVNSPDIIVLSNNERIKKTKISLNSNGSKPSSPLINAATNSNSNKPSRAPSRNSSKPSSPAFITSTTVNNIQLQKYKKSISPPHKVSSRKSSLSTSIKSSNNPPDTPPSKKEDWEEEVDDILDWVNTLKV